MAWLYNDMLKYTVEALIYPQPGPLVFWFFVRFVVRIYEQGVTMDRFRVSIVFARSFSRNLLWVGDFETGDWPIQNPFTDSPHFKSMHDLRTSLPVGHGSVKSIAKDL